MAENEAEMAEITKDVEPNFMDPNFILQNLNICSSEKLYNQPPFTIRAKQRLADIVAQQAVFYTMLCLKAYIGCDMPPSIVIIGTGTIGNAIIELLTSCGCQPYMSIYARSDVAAKQWRDRGYRSHHIIQRLVGGMNPDIFIFAFNLQSFPSVCRQMIDVVTPQSACINCIFGLNRKRIFRVLRINTVFRTFVEASRISSRLEKQLDTLMKDARAAIAVTDVKSAVSDFFQAGGVLSNLSETKPPLPSTMAAGAGNHHHDDSSVDSDDEADDESLGDIMMSVEDEACSLIAQRSADSIAHVITLLEFFNSNRGMPHPLARREAIESVLGDVIDEDREPMPSLNPHIVPVTPQDTNNGLRRQSRKSVLQRKSTSSVLGKYGAKSSDLKILKSRETVLVKQPSHLTFDFPTNHTSPLLNLKFPLTEVICQIHKKVGAHFQRYFSRFILISDIPPPIKSHPVDLGSVAGNGPPEWPPEPVYFNNILDIYADRRKVCKPIHDEDVLIDVYSADAISSDTKSKGKATLMLWPLFYSNQSCNLNYWIIIHISVVMFCFLFI